MANNKEKWLLFGDSVIGNSHKKNDLPCQDSHFYQQIGITKWGIALVSDGAGSAKLSHKGSDFIVNCFGKNILVSMLKSQKWFLCEKTPTEKEWNKIAIEIIFALRRQLYSFSHNQKVNIKDISATLIITLFSKDSILSINVGDGRGAYRNTQGEWKPIFTPFRGEEANHTVFVNSLMTENKETRELGEFKEYINTNIISEGITSVSILSDGVEKASFLCSDFDEENQKWTDPNMPYKPFFEPLYKAVSENKDDEDFVNGNKERIQRFLENGNEKLSNEGDDKTLVMGVFC